MIDTADCAASRKALKAGDRVTCTATKVEHGIAGRQRERVDGKGGRAAIGDAHGGADEMAAPPGRSGQLSADRGRECGHAAFSLALILTRSARISARR